MEYGGSIQCLEVIFNEMSFKLILNVLATIKHSEFFNPHFFIILIYLLMKCWFQKKNAILQNCHRYNLSREKPITTKKCYWSTRENKVFHSFINSGSSLNEYSISNWVTTTTEKLWRSKTEQMRLIKDAYKEAAQTGKCNVNLTNRI